MRSTGNAWTRRGRVAASARAVAAALAMGLALVGTSAPLVARAAEASAAEASTDAAEQATTSFNESFAAWAGYATTQQASFVSGATPVAASASGEAAWTYDTTGASRDAGQIAEDAQAAAAAAESTDELLEARRQAPVALRQVGQSTSAYVLGYDAVYKLDAATGEELARADLGARSPRDAQIAFAGNLLMVPTDEGGLVAFDEDLNKAWAGPAAATPRLSDRWSATSQIVEDAGRIIVAFSCGSAATEADPDGAAEAVLAAFSSVDGSVLWTGARATTPDVEGAAEAEANAAAFAYAASSATQDGTSTVVAPQPLMTDDGVAGISGLLSVFTVSGDQLLVSYGGDALMLVDAASGAIEALLPLEGPVANRIAALPVMVGGEDAFVVGASEVDEAGVASYTVAVVDVTEGILGESEPYRAEGYLRAARPVVVDTTAVFTADADASDSILFGDAALTSLDYTQALEGVASIRAAEREARAAAGSGTSSSASYAAPAAPEPAGSCVAPEVAGGIAQAAYGERAADATIELVYPDVRGNLCQVEYALADGIQAATVTTLQALDATPTYLAASTPVVNRDGTVLYQAGDALVALAPDEARAAATVVGGSEGLDTIAGALTGLTLPNGAGIGVGALVFVVGFAAYFAIKNRGNRARIDEGLVAPGDDARRPGGHAGRRGSAGDTRGGRL